MTKIISIVLSGFIILTVPNSKADEFKKYDKILSRESLTCLIFTSWEDNERIEYSTDGKGLWAKVVGGVAMGYERSHFGNERILRGKEWLNMKVTSYAKRKEKKVFLYTLIGTYANLRTYVDFERRVVMINDKKIRC